MEVNTLKFAINIFFLCMHKNDVVFTGIYLLLYYLFIYWEKINLIKKFMYDSQRGILCVIQTIGVNTLNTAINV